MLNLGHAYVVLNGARSQGVTSAPLTRGVALDSTFGALSSSPVKLDPVQHTMTVSPLLNTPSSSLSWQSDASVGSFGKPDPFTADLNAGALTASYPIDVPAGPGGLTPPISLAYNSAGVNEQHNPSAAGWVGEGWTLSMGAINWSEHNVLAGCQSTCGTNWENSWQLSGPYGTGSELIPPNINVSTYFDDTPNFYCGTGNPAAFPCPILWQTANESYAKIYAYVGPFSIPGAGPATNSPCFRVWLKNGIMEEFGCTQDSIQYFYEPGNGQGAQLSAWNLDLITDSQGNQIHLTYQQDMESWTNPVTHATFNYPRDVALSTIEYDSPTCHNAQTMCTGANWAPLVRVNFASSHNPARASSPLPTGCNTGANLRCDDPFDLSGSNGVAAPMIQSTFALNDLQVQVRSSGTGSWNTLRDYQLNYELSAPTTITDPSSGRQQSVAGMLDLTGFQQTGDTGATALLYSGKDNSTTSSFAYMKVFDLSSQHLVIGPNTTLSYWIYPQSAATSGQIRTTTTYDAYGNQVASDDPDANASISGHIGCTVNSVQYTACTTYDSTFQVLPTSSSNALNQTSSTGYTSTAIGGFGLWPVSMTDPNNQSTTYGYDSLGRMSSLTLPAETSGTTRTWSYTTWCSGPAAQAPCVELDETDRMNASTTVTTRGFYDGEGRLVETRVSGPNNQDVVTYVTYDIMGRKIFTSNPYFVAAYTGPAGPAAFSLPDSSQPGSSTAYPTLRQTAVTDALSQTTTTTASVQCGVSGTSDTGCYVLSTSIDANAHQRSALIDGLGHEGYDLRYTGNSGATYALYALNSYTYDQDGNLLTIKHPANTATTSFTYDTAGRKTGMNDPDRGVESYSYDPNGNPTQTVDARGSAGTIFQGYDGLNRPLWRNTTNSPTGACVTYSYDSTVNGNMGVGRKTGEAFTGSGGLSGSYAFVYDQRGQQTSMTTTINGTNYPVQASYDDAGDLISQTYPTGEVVNATYSAQGWLSQLTSTQGGTTTTLASNISYTGAAGAAMHITGMSLGNGVYSYGASYDLDQRLISSSLTRSSDSTLLYQTQPGYDAAGNVTSVTTTLQAGTDNQHFCDDEQNRLTSASANGTSACGSFTAGTLTSAQYQQSYAYDTNGRLTSSSQGSYTYGDSHHLHAGTATGNGYSAA